MGKLQRKETKIHEIQASVQSPEMLGNSDLSTLGQVLLEIHSSAIREYLSRTGG